MVETVLQVFQCLLQVIITVRLGHHVHTDMLTNFTKTNATLHATTVSTTQKGPILGDFFCKEGISLFFIHISFVNPSNRGEKKIQMIFSHCLVSVKNRTPPVTFIMDFLIIYSMYTYCSLIISHSP